MTDLIFIYEYESCNILKSLLIQVLLLLDIFYTFVSLFSKHQCPRNGLHPFRIVRDRKLPKVIEFRRFLKIDDIYDNKSCIALYLLDYFDIFGSLRNSGAVMEEATFYSMTFMRFENRFLQKTQIFLSPLLTLFLSH